MAPNREQRRYMARFENPGDALAEGLIDVSDLHFKEETPEERERREQEEKWEQEWIEEMSQKEFPLYRENSHDLF